MSGREMANVLLRDMADAQSQHVPVIRHKIGEETGRRLKSAGCSCGWQSYVWYSGDEYVGACFARHMTAVVSNSGVRSMLAPEGAK